MTSTITPPVRDAPRETPVWAALARREAGIVVRHPLFIVGVIASGWVMWSFNRDQLPHLWAYSTYVALGLAPLAVGSLIVGHLVASRARLHSTLEIELAAPAVQRTRTIGRIVGLLAPVPIAAMLAAGFAGYQSLLGSAGQTDLGELLVGPVVVALAGVAGVTAGTWLPSRFGGLLALGMFAAVQIGFHDAPGTLHWFGWWHSVLWHDSPDLWIRPTWAHLAYLAGITTVLTAVALLRHAPRSRSLLVLALGAGLVVPASVVQSRPPSDDAVDSRFAQVADPIGYWRTIEGDSVTYHIHPTYEGWVEWWDSAIQAVLDPIPASSRPMLVVEQWHHPFLSQIEEEFGSASPEGRAINGRGDDLDSAFTDSDPWPIRVSGRVYIRELSPLAIAVAQRAVGFPLLPIELTADATEDDRMRLEVACDAEGQAREVVAAWLAAQASSDLAEIYQGVRANGLGAEGVDTADGPTEAVNWNALGWTQVGWFGGGSGTQAVIGSPTATDLAAQLLDLSDSHVAATVAANWDKWTDPATTTDAIVNEFGLVPAPTPEQWLERTDLDPADYRAAIAAYPRWIGEPEPLDQPYPTCP